MKKEDFKKLVELRKEAIPHLGEINKLTDKARKIIKDEDWSYDYIWNGGNLKKILRIVELLKQKKFKEAGEEIQKL